MTCGSPAPTARNDCPCRIYALDVTSSAPPGATVTDPEVAASVRLLHSRRGWGRMAVTSLVAFLLAAGAYSDAESQGAPPPPWFFVIIVVLGTLTAVGVVAVIMVSALLRRRPAEVRAQAVPLAARHRGGQRPHHYPPPHLLSWVARWVGMLLILVVAVVSVPAVFDGVAYLAGGGRTATFDPLSYETSCSVRGGCVTSTDGILETGGAGIQATWPDVVPLGKPFTIRVPVWRWGLGEALISSDALAVAAVAISLLIEGAGVVVVVYLVKLTKNWRRHRRQHPTPAAASLA